MTTEDKTPRKGRNETVSRVEKLCYGNANKKMAGKTSRFMPNDKNTSAQAGNRKGARTLALGTIVYTLDGALPVEYLNAGDRIVTRAGARVLRDLTGNADCGFSLRFDTPQIVYTEGEQVVMA